MPQQVQTAADSYIQNVVNQHTPNIEQDIAKIIRDMSPHVHLWANGYQYEIKPSGSIAKGTAITGATDADIFISLEPNVTTYNTLQNVYETLRNRFNGAGYQVREQNVSIGINHGGIKVDIVAGVKHHLLGGDHSIYKRKASTWTKTNVDEHIKHISESGRDFEIRAIKIWRKLRGLDFPSFYLELSVLEALRGVPITSTHSSKFIRVINYLSTDFLTKTIKDPSNQSNSVSEDLTILEKNKIKEAALVTLGGNWEQAIW